MPDVNKNRIKYNGVWRAVGSQYVKVAGEWKQATNVYTKVSGTWKTSFPFPVSADSSLAALVVNGTPVSPGGSITVPNGTTSVTVTAIPTSSTATVTGDGARSVSYSGSPNSLSVTITAEDGVSSSTYSFTVIVAAPSQVTIYWTYCNGCESPVSGSGVVSGTSDATTACNQKKSELGNPSYWNCAGSTVAQAGCPACPPPPTPTCTCSVVSAEACVGTGWYGVWYADSCTGEFCGSSYTPNANCP